MRETMAIAAMVHGRLAEKLRGSFARARAGVPHRWQNFAPGVRGALQAEQVAPARGAPQFEQNLPAAGVPHAAQVTVEPPGAGSDGRARGGGPSMRGSYIRAGGSVRRRFKGVEGVKGVKGVKGDA